jgi:hypothetical protein
MKSNLLNECIIVSKEIDDKFILAKNRDRTYKPKLEIIHELIDGVEVLHLHDLQTDWSEGINEFGIGIVNTALVVGYDEKELKIIRKTGNISDDGDKIRTALSKNNLKDAVSSIVKYKKGLRGHTFISSPNNMITVEMSNRTPIIKLVNTKDPLVRTNHGHAYTDAGYSSGKSFESSKIREISAELQITKAKKWYELAPLLRKKRERIKQRNSGWNDSSLLHRPFPNMTNSGSRGITSGIYILALWWSECLSSVSSIPTSEKGSRQCVGKAVSILCRADVHCGPTCTGASEPLMRLC